MILFIVCLIAFVIGLLIAVGGGFLLGANDGRGAAIGTGTVIVAIAVIVTIFNSFTTIPVRTVGIELSFGKPVGLLNNGMHWVAPWHAIDKEWDGSVQTLKVPVTVRLGNQTTATVDTTLQWNLHPSADVLELYRSYKTFSNVETNLVERQLQHVLNDQFAKYDPLRTLNGDTSGPSIDQLAAAAHDDLQKAVGGAIQIGTLTIPLVHYDGPTEDRLRQYQQSIANTRIAEQDQQTAKVQKETNDLLAQSASSKDPGVLAQDCLALVKELAAKDQLKNLPVNALAFCGNAGAQTPVIVGAK